MNETNHRARGFSLLELMIAISIAAILGAVAVYGYQQYTVRAAAADLVSAHHNLRNAAQALGDSAVEDCAALAGKLDRKLLADPYARLDVGFEAVPGGFRPVLTVCATAQDNARNVAVARRAYETFAEMGVAEKTALRTDSVVSFAVRLTQGDAALCAKAAAPVPCGQSAPVAALAQPVTVAAQPTQPAQPAQPAANVLPPVPQPRANQPVPQPVAPAATCPAGQEKVLITTGAQAQSACAPRCQTGERRNTAGLCIKDEPPPPPAWAANAPDPGTPPSPAQPGQLPTCADGSKLVTTFVRGVLANTCVKDACPADQKPDGSGQCIPRCSAPLIWDQLLHTCIDKSSPPACPDGLSRAGDGQCTCSSGVLPEQDGSCPSTCEDTYGPTCDLDFGKGMCGEAFVQEMCKQFCGLCSADGSGPPKRGTGGAPVLPALGPYMDGVLPRNAGETVVLDDQQLAKLFGVVSPDGSPVSITKMELGGGMGASSSWDFRRREDGRWQITATSAANEIHTGLDGHSTYQYADGDYYLVATFTNGVGSTQSGSAYINTRK